MDEPGRPSPKPKITSEDFESAMDRFADAFDLDLDVDGMDDEDRREFSTQKRVLFVAMKKGRLTISAEGIPVYTPTDGRGPVTFREPEGATFMEMDKAKAGHTSMRAQMLLLGAMTGQTTPRFVEMRQRDLKVCQSIMSFCLAG